MWFASILSAFRMMRHPGIIAGSSGSKAQKKKKVEMLKEKNPNASNSKLGPQPQINEL
jgi:hypothetical protein